MFGITGVTGTVEGRELAWNFVKTRWSELHDRYSGGFLLSRLVKVSRLVLFKSEMFQQGVFNCN